MDKNYLTNNKIGGYNLPADFHYVTIEFLKSLVDLSFEDRINKICAKISKNADFKCSFSSVENAEFPASVVSLDDTVSVLELFDGESANYIDYFFGVTEPIFKIYAMASVIISAYVDLCESSLIKFGDKINIALNSSDGILVLSAYYCKMVGLNVETIICGSQKQVDALIKGISFQSITQAEVDYLINAVFEETDYLLDPDTAFAFGAIDLYYSDYEDDNVTLVLGLASPYFNARRVLKCLTNKNEISIDVAINKLSDFTAVEVPEPILTKKIQPFFSIDTKVSEFDAIELIKQTF